MTTPAGRRLMIGFEGLDPEPVLAPVLRETGAGSVILFARNLVDAAQARDLVTRIRSLVDWPLLLAVDQEGGPVVRLTEGATVFPGNMALGAADDAELALRQGRVSGAELAAIGFDLNLAPVVDLQTNPVNPGIGIRSFGDDPSRGAALATALVRGHAEAGVATCLKHFPGLGAAAVDPHVDLPVLDASLEDLRVPHLEVFSRVFAETGDLPVTVMTTHLLARGLDAERPATLSRRVVDGLLRRELGFGGLVVSDCLEMGAIVKHGGVPEAAVGAAVAGHDLLPVCHTAERQRGAARALTAALAEGRLDREEHEAALARILALNERSRPDPGTTAAEDGAGLAREISRRAVHLFADPGGLLPLAADAAVLVIAVRPRLLVGIEEDARRDPRAPIAGAFGAAGLRRTEVLACDPADADARAAAVSRARVHPGPVVLLGWDARGDADAANLLAALVAACAPRLIAAHLRNPFDQALVPAEVTALATFGFHRAQLEALAAVLAGAVEARGRMPAAWR
ncbi:MAG: glycoside hydrolase family 3 N-terminal domain-containing protein [Planctomycetota bacterium]